MIGDAPLCLFCIHYTGMGERLGPTCIAFPKGIPDRIFYDAEDHKKPVKGDHGLQFVQDPKKPKPSV